MKKNRYVQTLEVVIWSGVWANGNSRDWNDGAGQGRYCLSSDGAFGRFVVLGLVDGDHLGRESNWIVEHFSSVVDEADKRCRIDAKCELDRVGQF